MTVRNSYDVDEFYFPRVYDRGISAALEAEERALGVGAKIYRGKNGQYVKNGDVIPSEIPPYTHLAAPINGKPEDVRISSFESGLVAGLTESGATIGGAAVTLHRFLNGGYQATNTELAGITPLVGEQWVNTTDTSIHIGDGVTQGGIKHVNRNTLKGYSYLRFDSVDDMVSGISFYGGVYNLTLGDKCFTNGMIWEVISTPVTELSDFKPVSVVELNGFAPAKDGSTDDYAKILSAHDQDRFMRGDNGEYYLSATPNDYSKSLSMQYDYNTKFVGPGAEFLGGYGRLLTNPYSLVDGPYFFQRTEIKPPESGTVNHFTIEGELALEEDIVVSATLTNSSSTITCDTTGMYPGQRLYAEVGGVPDADFPVNDVPPYFGCARILTIDSPTQLTLGTQTLTGVVEYQYTGTTKAVDLTAKPNQRNCQLYVGNSSGGRESVDSETTGINVVTYVKAGTGEASHQGMEIDINVESQDAVARGLFITGNSLPSIDADVAIEIGRANTAWFYGSLMNNVYFGHKINAKNTAIEIDSLYIPAPDSADPNNTVLLRGIAFDNISYRSYSLFSGKQLNNAAECIYLARYTDTSPLGFFMACMSEDEASRVFSVGITGEIETNAPASSNGSTTSSGSIICNGITVRSGANIQLGNAVSGGTITMYDSNGAAFTVPATLI